jgi:hypothetical protein
MVTIWAREKLNHQFLELLSIPAMLPHSNTEAHRVPLVSMVMAIPLCLMDTTLARGRLNHQFLELLFTQDMPLPLNTEAHRVPLVFSPMLLSTALTTTDTSKLNYFG